MTLRLLLCLLALLPQDSTLPQGADMDYGPFFTSTLSRSKSDKDADILAFKAITIKVGKDAALSFDTDLLRMAAGWTGGFLDLSETHLTTSKGKWPTRPGAALQFSTRPAPGWAKGDDFKDPRPDGRGPLPKDWARYNGLYLDGKSVILSYTVGDCKILEKPGFLNAGGGAFMRTFHVGPSVVPLRMRIADDDAPSRPAVDLIARDLPATVLPVGAAGLHLVLPAHAEPWRFDLLQWIGERPENLGVGAIPDLPARCKGGPARWTPAIVTQGTTGKDDGPYAVDTLTLPDANPWKSWLRVTAHDFFSDGRAAIATWSGDVWVVSGIDSGLRELRWKRFATGLYEPLGLRIVDDQIYVLGRDQITRLHDLNGDGEADFYENFNNLGVTMASYHAFHYDLQTDRAGNFYYLVGGNHVDPEIPYHNCLLRVPKDGSTIESLATGFRATNGMAIGPNDEIVCGDNEGNWIPSSRLNWVKKGGFYGFVSDPGRTNAAHPAPNRGEPEKPLCWIPKPQDNSSGGQVWVTSDRWGPLQGHLLHTSYGTCTLFHVLPQAVGDTMQGAVVQFPLKFASGIMRARFSPADGQLYLSGLRGWQSSSPRDGALHRVRYTGKPLRSVMEMKVSRDAIDLTFSDPLDPETANDADSYGIQQWNYLWSEKYGSPDLSAADPKKKGRDTVDVKSAKLSADGRSVRLEIPGLKPVMQMGIKVRVRTADGAALALEIYGTINQVP
jgi:glucose/arabinose dehydrogenase